jgi:hypothetical protein
MADRHTLHKSKLEDFKEWLINDGWVIENIKGFYEVLRAKKGKRTILIYSKLEAKEHYTIPDNCMGIFIAYLKSRKNSF